MKAHHEVKVQDGLHDESQQQHGGRCQHEDAAPGGQADAEGAAQVRGSYAQMDEGGKLRQLRQAVHNVQQLHDLPMSGKRES